MKFLHVFGEDEYPKAIVVENEKDLRFLYMVCNAPSDLVFREGKSTKIENLLRLDFLDLSAELWDEIDKASIATRLREED